MVYPQVWHAAQTRRPVLGLTGCSTEPNGTVQPIHEKAMPVMLMTATDVDV